MQRRLFWIVLCVVAVAAVLLLRSRHKENQFGHLMTVGAGFLETGDAAKAVAAYQKAEKLAPENLDVHLNLANAYLLAGDGQAVISECQAALNLDHNSAAAYYLMGCAYLRLNQAQAAVQALQQSQKIDPAVTALNFQLGLAQARLGHIEEALREFQTVIQFEPDHPSAHYQLSLLYRQAGRTAEAEQELAKHQQLLAKGAHPPSDPLAFEKCKYTRPRTAFTLEQPEPHGVPVRFVNDTSMAFGQQAARYRGPIGVLDYNHDGRNSLFVMEENGFVLLNNSNGHFAPLGAPLPGTNNAGYRQCLVGDLNNDRFEDVIVLGERASHVFRFATNGEFREFTAASGLKDLRASEGLLADLDFTGKLDLLAVLPEGKGLRQYQNLGSFYFQDNTAKSGLPESVPGLEHVAIEDYRNEDLPDIFLTRPGQEPRTFAKERAGGFAETNLAANLPVGGIIAFGDLNNDLRPDLVLADEREIKILFNGVSEQLSLALNGFQPKGIVLVDFDNDGWMDVLAFGNGVRLWRNQGKRGFQDVTRECGLDKIGAVEFIAVADFDQDGDTDLVVGTAGGMEFWRNEGGNANRQLKLQLTGNRSNASALGVRLELVSGHWRTIRTLRQLPFEIGVGKRDKIEMIKARWADLETTVLEVPVQAQPMSLVELALPAGSCPYLYAWDGQRMKFVSDMLGAAPLGLPLSQTRLIEADPEELLALGNEEQFQPRDGAYDIRITEELREVLYLDQAKLVVADHPAGTVLCPTSKLRPAKPFPAAELWTLRRFAAPREATRSDGLDATAALACVDEKMIGPVRLREPQLRGLAEPYSITMDFGPLPTEKPLVLLQTGWLRFGGGMANVAASLDTNLPFPFPTLEAELADGTWVKVPADVGAPAGKTKTIVVDLDRKLPAGARRLRLSTAFEIYWDAISLCERVGSGGLEQVALRPDRADLHWRGFSQFAPLPESLPLTPDYDKVTSGPPWRRTPTGWCTRYGPVQELVQERDDALVLLNGGDELSLSFLASKLPPKRYGFVRDFFLYVVGWDKDADFHVAQGCRVEPLPFKGLDDQAYAQAVRPATLDSAWIKKYNTRFVGPWTVEQDHNRTAVRGDPADR